MPRKWIDVNVELPNKTGRYLVTYFQDPEGLKTNSKPLVDTDSYMGAGRWAKGYRTVTHWKSLPAPAKEAKKKCD